MKQNTFLWLAGGAVAIYALYEWLSSACANPSSSVYGGSLCNMFPQAAAAAPPVSTSGPTQTQQANPVSVAPGGTTVSTQNPGGTPSQAQQYAPLQTAWTPYGPVVILNHQAGPYGGPVPVTTPIQVDQPVLPGQSCVPKPGYACPNDVGVIYFNPQSLQNAGMGVFPHEIYFNPRSLFGRHGNRVPVHTIHGRAVPPIIANPVHGGVPIVGTPVRMF